jgi:uncharacterized membrane protein YccC
MADPKTTTVHTEVVRYDDPAIITERVAVAAFIAGYTDPTRRSYATDLRRVVARSRPALSIPFGSGALRKVGSAMTRDVGLRAHAVRLSVAVGGGSLLYSLADLSHGYWVPLTTLAILQPTEHGTRVRSLQRVAGTLVAADLIVVIPLATDSPWWLVACASITAFLLYAFDERGYFWLVVLLTPTVLLMMSCVDGDKVALDRVAQTVLGIVIGIVIAETANEVARIRDVHRAQAPI